MRQFRLIELLTSIIGVSVLLTACSGDGGNSAPPVVDPGPGGEEVKAVSIKVNKTSVTLEEGQTVSITAKVTYDNGDSLTIEPECSSSTSSVASVDDDCVVLGKKVGAATITVSDPDSDYAATVNIEVTEAPANSIRIVGAPASFTVGESKKLTIENADSYACKSSNENVISIIGDCTIKAENAGSAIITAEDDDGNEASVEIQVKKAGSTTAPVGSREETDTPQTLGYVYSKDATLFKIWSPDTTDIKLYVEDNIDSEKFTEYDLEKDSTAKYNDGSKRNDVYVATVDGDLDLKLYHYKVKGRIARDPYARMVKPGTDYAVVVDMGQTELANADWRKDTIEDNGYFKEPEDAVIYEMHIRDFTIAANSGVDAKFKGKFLGAVQKNTKNGSVSTGLQHLIDMGITHVQILPFYDYGTCSAKDPLMTTNKNWSGTKYPWGDDECYNWGYDPENFNVPEERYSASDLDDVESYRERIREVKEMVNTLHENGIRVIMDVVYNHTWTAGDGLSKSEIAQLEAKQEIGSLMGPITQKYFAKTRYKKTDGQWGEIVNNDLSGTGNALDGNNPIVQDYVLDSMKYWVEEFNIDGFRFDLIGAFQTQTVANWVKDMNDLFPTKNLLIYGEPWTGGGQDIDENQKSIGKTVRLGHVKEIQQSIGTDHFAVFNNKFRENIKGENNHGGGEGYIYGWTQSGSSTFLNNVLTGLKGSPYSNACDTDVWCTGFTGDPSNTINYISAHDNLALADKLRDAREGICGDNGEKCDYLKGFSANQETQVNAFGNSIVLSAQGIPFIHSGVEMHRTKAGSGKSYTVGKHYESGGAKHISNHNIQHNTYKFPDEFNEIDWDLKKSNKSLFDAYQKMISIRKAHPAFRLRTHQEINQYMKPTINGDYIYTKFENVPGDTWKEIAVLYNPLGTENSYMAGSGWNIGFMSHDANAQGAVNGSIDLPPYTMTILYKD